MFLQGSVRQTPMYNYIFEQYRAHQVTGAKHCKHREELRHIGQTYLCLLQSNIRQQVFVIQCMVYAYADLTYKKLCYCRRTVQHTISVKILSSLETTCTVVLQIYNKAAMPKPSSVHLVVSIQYGLVNGQMDIRWWHIGLLCQENPGQPFVPQFQGGTGV